MNAATDTILLEFSDIFFLEIDQSPLILLSQLGMNVDKYLIYCFNCFPTLGYKSEDLSLDSIDKIIELAS